MVVALCEYKVSLRRIVWSAVQSALFPTEQRSNRNEKFHSLFAVALAPVLLWWAPSNCTFHSCWNLCNNRTEWSSMELPSRHIMELTFHVFFSLTSQIIGPFTDFKRWTGIKWALHLNGEDKLGRACGWLVLLPGEQFPMLARGQRSSLLFRAAVCCSIMTTLI